MPLTALLLVLLAALLHAFWNLLAKDARDSSAFMWWGVTVGAIWYGAWMATQVWLGLPREVWLVFAASLVAEVAYLALITRGYARGDLSQVYPIARGSPPLLIALWSAIFLAERLPLLGYVGIALLVFGIYLASLPALDDVLKPLRVHWANETCGEPFGGVYPERGKPCTERSERVRRTIAATITQSRPFVLRLSLRRLRAGSSSAGHHPFSIAVERFRAFVAAVHNRSAPYRPAQLALLAAICVSIYTTLDKIGVTYTAPPVYNWWVYAGIAVCYVPFVWSRPHRASTVREWQTNWRRILIGSVATVGSYMLALTGLSLTAASYMGAVRATSVVISALFGWLLLKERFGAVRVFAAALMVVGLGLIAIAE